MFARLVELERESAQLRSELGVSPRIVSVLPPQAEANYVLFTSLASDLLSIHAPDGTYLFVSESCRHLFGYEPYELVGRSAYDFFHPEDVARIAETHLAQYEPGALMTIEYRLRKKDESYVWVETKTSTSRSDQGLEHIVSITRDVSERHAHASAQAALIEELERRMQQVRELSGLLPICAWCKSIRDDAGYWHGVEAYLSSHAEVDFTHGICPDCVGKLGHTHR